MACTDYSAWHEFLANWQFFDTVWCPYVDAVGPTLAPLLVIGPIGVALYLFSGSFLLPLVLIIILGGVFVGQLPAGPTQLIGIAVLLGVTLAGYAITQRLDR